MSKGKRYIFFLSTSLGSLLYLAFNEILSWEVYFLPISFILLYPFYENKLSKMDNVSYSLVAVLCMYWLRLVVLPAVAYAIPNTSLTDYSIPIFLTIYEFLVVSTCVLLKRYNRFGVQKVVSLKGNTIIYGFYGLMALIVYFLYARGEGLFDFVVKTVNTVERGGDIVDSKSLLVKQFIDCGMLFVYLMFSNYCSRKYAISHKTRYVYYVLFVSLLFLSIISGERRTSIIYKAFAIVVVLIRLLPTQKNKIIRVVAVAALVVLVFMTIYKSFYAYMYSSYLEAINSRDTADALGGNTFDAYFYGIQTIAKNIDFIEKGTLSLYNLIYDFFRSLFGIHFFIKDGGYTTGQLYNLSIYGGEQTNGYLFAGISYGYAYFGLLLAPIIPLCIVLLMTKIEIFMCRTASIEMLYIYAMIFMRLAFGFVGDPSPLLNLSTQILIIYGLFYLFSKLLNTKC